MWAWSAAKRAHLYIDLLEYDINLLAFIIGLPESEGPLEYVFRQLDSRETDHTEVLEVPWSHDMLVAANSHRVIIGTASVSVEDNLSRGSLLDHGKARFHLRYPESWVSASQATLS